MYTTAAYDLNDVLHTAGQRFEHITTAWIRAAIKAQRSTLYGLDEVIRLYQPLGTTLYSGLRAFRCPTVRR
ncbi:hypothetical protein PM082_017550 [Marasmius tenuissimus]|nr:hypothetical protein PM082_017550 [Marasmius tenuissimus]